MRHGAGLLRALGAAVVTVTFALPLLFMVTGSLREPQLPPPRTPQLVPEPLGLASYDRAFDLVDLGRYALNSMLVAAMVAPLSVLVASLAGFALLGLSRRVTRLVVAASVFALMIPATALIVPRFTLFRALGVTDTYVPLVAPALLATSPIYVLLFAWAFRRLPADLYDACRLADMSPLAIWWRMAMPLVRPVAVGVGVLAFVISWGNFLDPLVYLYDPDLYTLPLGLRALAELDRTDYPVLLAGAVVATAPVVAVFLVAQRWFLTEYRGSQWLNG
ncbi:MAG TPA: carbohydrate ABC transporter permease [Gaiellaceae bacterium]|nr:carbohydrate ABC transporter permease [Gaiellaceae bacterium]